MSELEQLLKGLIELVGLLLDLTGVFIIAAGVIGAFPAYARTLAQGGSRSQETRKQAFYTLRNRVGMTVLLGLEVLVAADIIKTVAVEPSLESVAVLGLLVLVRTFLSWTLVVDVEGHWPWKRSSSTELPPPPAE